MADLVETGGWHTRHVDGTLIIYVDRKYPAAMRDEIAFHERIEADMMDHHGMPYREAHVVAEEAERAMFGEQAFKLSEDYSERIAKQNAVAMLHHPTRKVPERERRRQRTHAQPKAGGVRR